MSASCVTPWTVTHQVPLSVGSPRQAYWSGLAFPSPGDLPHPGTEATSPALAGGFFITEPSPVLTPPLPNPAHFKHLSPPSCPWLPTLPPLAPRCLTVSPRVTPLQRPGRAPQDSQGIPAESFTPRRLSPQARMPRSVRRQQRPPAGSQAAEESLQETKAAARRQASGYTGRSLCPPREAQNRTENRSKWSPPGPRLVWFHLFA